MIMSFKQKEDRSFICEGENIYHTDPITNSDEWLPYDCKISCAKNNTSPTTNTPPFVTQKMLRMVKFAEDYAQPLSNCAPIINDWHSTSRQKRNKYASRCVMDIFFLLNTVQAVRFSQLVIYVTAH